ncbi:M15 family metallopeptidase [Arenimonas sp. GDDSR-1]|uniref:M15 family metallopeptidase n=1 Tax=Arenimonas sp. GDDSR-1 TaxID=2950125 RepID=UPI00262A2A6B|nr:M15 family metallopeptidase [Arenimonas sp. GDDSR-1]
MKPVAVFLLMISAWVASAADRSPLADVRRYAPSIQLDMRYATARNFTGRPVTGYMAAKCLLHAPAARALAAAEAALRSRGFGLIIYDCYRPQRAVADFMAWAKAPDDPVSKSTYYPDLDKSRLVPDYIAEKSGHSKGATADIGLLDCSAGQCREVDMGTPFDFFGTQANTDWPGASPAQKASRKLLLEAMAAQGFVNYPLEWWHFTWKAGTLPDEAYDFPIE